MEYPFQDILKEKCAQKDIGNNELARRVGVSTGQPKNWKVFLKIDLATIVKLSEILEFNFIQDYNEWVVEHAGTPITLISDVKAPYVPEPKATTTICLESTFSNLEANYGALLRAVKDAGNRLGFTIK